MLRSWGEWDKNDQGGVQEEESEVDAQQRKKPYVSESEKE